MIALMWEILASVGIIVAGAAQIVVEQIRAGTLRGIFREAVSGAEPEDRPAIVIALAELLRGQSVARRDGCSK